MALLGTTINAGFEHSNSKSNGVTHEQQSAKAFFEENTGEMHIGKAVCFSDDLRIVRNVRPKFSQEFLAGKVLRFQ